MPKNLEIFAEIWKEILRIWISERNLLVEIGSEVENEITARNSSTDCSDFPRRRIRAENESSPISADEKVRQIRISGDK
jgi:hypothetical protein